MASTIRLQILENLRNGAVLPEQGQQASPSVTSKLEEAVLEDLGSALDEFVYRALAHPLCASLDKEKQRQIAIRFAEVATSQFGSGRLFEVVDTNQSLLSSDEAINNNNSSDETQQPKSELAKQEIVEIKGLLAKLAGENQKNSANEDQILRKLNEVQNMLLAGVPVLATADECLETKQEVSASTTKIPITDIQSMIDFLK